MSHCTKHEGCSAFCPAWVFPVTESQTRACLEWFIFEAIPGNRNRLAENEREEEK